MNQYRFSVMKRCFDGYHSELDSTLINSGLLAQPWV